MLTKELTHKDIVTLLQRSILAGTTTLLAGRPGTGKTSMVFAAAKAERVKASEITMLTAPLIDPFTDLIGIPIPRTLKNGRTVMRYARPSFFYTAKVVFIDEVNRAPPKTINAVLELVQFRSLCGVKLPNLQCVILAGNEPEPGLMADPFEGALIDRMDMVINVPYVPDEDFFKTRFKSEKLHNALLEWWKTDLDPTQQATVSPRRLEKIGSAIERGTNPKHADTNAIMGRSVNLPFAGLMARVANGCIPLENFISDIKKYCTLVPTDNEVANQFLLAMNLFKSSELNAVRDIAFALPKELLKSLMRNEALWLRFTKAIVKHAGSAEATVYKEQCHERVGSV